jgi:hypothetical protein
MSSVSKVCLYREQKYFYELFLSILAISILCLHASSAQSEAHEGETDRTSTSVVYGCAAAHRPAV